ncbi:MAG: bifunctional metallophosphatase/5'-nucleotidase, partial [Deltaproteobacteria bacterium]|nr:bifunctional metallophosphatase/5'-nucleotidase [Deltaproteobacteria bacterium]MBW2534211.1 bifunctional metallophosphatase/5'-nucleotidase [Deltaproteobacteria bacterium]
ANYWFEDPSEPGASQVGKISQPYHIFDVDGLVVAAIGMGTLTSITSIYDMPNSLGITPLTTAEVAQFYVDLLRPLVDVVIVISHMGLTHDHDLIRHTSGIDIVVGGHNHIALQPPKTVWDCCVPVSHTDSRCRTDENGTYIELNDGEGQDPDQESRKMRRSCQRRPVILSHPGAFAKFVGRIDLVVSNDPNDFPAGFPYDPVNGFEIVATDYTLFPMNALTPEDPTILKLLERYGLGLDLFANLDLMIGYAPQGSKRGATNGGDSQLGNLIAQSVWLRQGVQTDFSMTNTTGIRADVVPGPVTVEQMFNIFPFDNAIAKMQLSGVEVQGLFDYIARRSTGRGCKSQAQIAGMRVVIDCQAQPDPAVPPGKATNIYIGPAMVDGEPVFCASDLECCPQGLAPEQCAKDYFGSCDSNTGRCWQPMDPVASYEMGTSTYLANGGSGYRMLQRNTTQFDTKIQQRDALIDYLRGGKACGSKEDGTLHGCRNDGDCQAVLGDTYVCACPGAVTHGEDGLCHTTGECPFSDDPGPGDGACVLRDCRQSVGFLEREACSDAPSIDVQVQCDEALDPCERGGEMCKFLACIDANLGNVTDGRIKMVGK